MKSSSENLHEYELSIGGEKKVEFREDYSSQSSHAFWPDDEAAQQIGPSELQAAGLEPCPGEDFATAGHLSLSPASKLRHHSSQFLPSPRQLKGLYGAGSREKWTLRSGPCR